MKIESLVLRKKELDDQISDQNKTFDEKEKELKDLNRKRKQELLSEIEGLKKE